MIEQKNNEKNMDIKLDFDLIRDVLKKNGFEFYSIFYRYSDYYSLKFKEVD